MSPRLLRLLRLLLKLYPRRFRRRYGDELLDLQHELKAHAGVSPARLLVDLLAGALLVRPVRRTRLLIAAVCVIAGLTIAGPIIAGRSAHPSAAYPQIRLTAKRIPATSASRGCFVAAGSFCSLTPCTIFVAQPASEGAVAHPSTPGTQHRVPLAPAPVATPECVSSPHTASPVFVVTAHPLASRPATALREAGP